MPKAPHLMPKSYSLEPQSSRRVQVVKSYQSDDNRSPVIYDLKVFVASESTLRIVLRSVKDDIECVGLKWNEKRRAVEHLKRGCFI